MAAIVGGGRGAKPGQISLAHNGVLFFDELPEFSRPVLETLRQPIETGEVVVARANAHVRYPCRFLLVAAAGAALLLACDLVARLLVRPYELPVGMILGVVGSLLFLTLLHLRPARG